MPGGKCSPGSPWGDDPVYPGGPLCPRSVRDALAAGPEGAPLLLAQGVGRATRLPGQLAFVNFGLWLSSSALGLFGFRALFGWSAMNAAIVVAIGVLFGWGISFTNARGTSRSCARGGAASAVGGAAIFGASTAAPFAAGCSSFRSASRFQLHVVAVLVDRPLPHAGGLVRLECQDARPGRLVHRAGAHRRRRHRARGTRAVAAHERPRAGRQPRRSRRSRSSGSSCRWARRGHPAGGQHRENATHLGHDDRGARGPSATASRQR